MTNSCYFVERTDGEQTLAHHGILGQKWGVRRFQNKDGSLTAEGKKRRETQDNDNKDEEADKKNESDKPKKVKKSEKNKRTETPEEEKARKDRQWERSMAFLYGTRYTNRGRYRVRPHSLYDNSRSPNYYSTLEYDPYRRPTNRSSNYYHDIGYNRYRRPMYNTRRPY